MPYTIQSMYEELAPLIPRYREENAWSLKWFAPVNADNILEAWRLYKATYKNALGLLLLGEEGMRKKEDLVVNFGLTSTHGPEDDEAKFLNTLVPKRVGLGGASSPNMVGPGSILSDRRWTPLLNDAWLFGGVHQFQDFHHVAEGIGDAGNTSFEKLAAGSASAGGAAPSPGGDIRQQWLAWFQKNMNVLYENWGPRVYTREVLGLMTFGYKPVFTKQELGFRCENKIIAGEATFQKYLNSLTALEFHHGPQSRPKVLKALSEFLFEDENALK